MDQRKIIVFAEGGFAHFLKHLEGAYFSASILRRDVVAVTNHHKALGFLDLSQIVCVRSTEFSERATDSGLPLRSPSFIDMKSDEFFRSFDFTAASPPPLLKSLYRDYLRPGPIVTTGMYFPPGPRFLLATSLFRLSPYLAGEVAKKIQELDGPVHKSIGIHLRNTDRATDFKKSQEQLRKRLRQSQVETVFVASDDDRVTEEFRADFNGIHFFGLKKEFRTLADSRNLHLGVKDEDALEQLIIALADIFLLSKCRIFIPAYKSRTQWSHLIRAMRSPLGSLFMQSVTESRNSR